jgi:hypothetical protein
MKTMRVMTYKINKEKNEWEQDKEVDIKIKEIGFSTVSSQDLKLPKEKQLNMCFLYLEGTGYPDYKGEGEYNILEPDLNKLWFEKSKRKVRKSY